MKHILLFDVLCLLQVTIGANIIENPALSKTHSYIHDIIGSFKHSRYIIFCIYTTVIRILTNISSIMVYRPKMYALFEIYIL